MRMGAAGSNPIVGDDVSVSDRSSTLMSRRTTAVDDQTLLVETDVNDGTATPTVNGEIDIATVADLGDGLAKAIAARPRELVVDLGSTTFIDCSGMAAIAWAPPGRSAGAQGHRPRTQPVSPKGDRTHRNEPDVPDRPLEDDATGSDVGTAARGAPTGHAIERNDNNDL